MRPGTLDLEERIIEELAFDPRITSDDIAVCVKEGVVTLHGSVPSLNEKWSVEDAIKRVRGVRGIADELVVDVPATHVRNDTDIAVALQRRFESNPMVPADVTFLVEHASVTLSGEVRWHHQAQEALAEARRVGGVRDVANLIVVKPMGSLTAGEIRQKIHAALERTASLAADGVTIAVSDGTVTLGGTVRTWLDRENAAQAAWSLPGVIRVENGIAVHP